MLHNNNINFLDKKFILVLNKNYLCNNNVALVYFNVFIYINDFFQKKLFFKFFKKSMKSEVNFLIFLKKKGLVFKKGQNIYKSFKDLIFKKKTLTNLMWLSESKSSVNSDFYYSNQLKPLQDDHIDNESYNNIKKKSKLYKSFFEILDQKQTLKKIKRKLKDGKKISFKSNFSYRKKENILFLKSFFLKAKVLKKKLDVFFKKISVKNNYYDNFYRLLFISLIKSHFLLFLFDCKFFIKKGFIFINGIVIRDPFYQLKVGDRVHIPFFKKYYSYINGNNTFFEKKIDLMKRKQLDITTFDKLLNPLLLWYPNFLKKFIFFNLDIPLFLEVDFFTLTFIFLKKDKKNLKKNFFLNKMMSVFLSKSYNWKRIS